MSTIADVRDYTAERVAADPKVKKQWHLLYEWLLVHEQVIEARRGGFDVEVFRITFGGFLAMGAILLLGYGAFCVFMDGVYDLLDRAGILSSIAHFVGW